MENSFGEFLLMALPWPPSVNTYWRRGPHSTYLSKRGREYKQQVAEKIASEGIRKMSGRLSVALSLSAPNKRAYDVDNRVKAVLDSLQDAGVFEDDEQIDELHVVRLQPGQDCVKVFIAQISQQQKE